MKTKNMLVQIGKGFYSLKLEFEIKDAQELKELIDSNKYDLRLLCDSNGLWGD